MSNSPNTQGIKMPKPSNTPGLIAKEDLKTPIPRKLNLYILSMKDFDPKNLRLRQNNISHVKIEDMDENSLFQKFWSSGHGRFRKTLRYLSHTSMKAEDDLTYQTVHMLKNTRNLSILAYPAGFSRLIFHLRGKVLDNLFLNSLGSRNETILMLRQMKRKLPHGLFIKLFTDDSHFLMQRQNWLCSELLATIQNLSFSLLEKVAVLKNGKAINAAHLNRIVKLKEIVTGHIDDKTFALLANQFNNWRNLKILDLELTAQRINFLEAAAENGRNIKTLKIRHQKVHKEKFNLANEIECIKHLRCIQALPEISELALIFPNADSKSGSQLSLKFLKSFKKLKSLTLHAQNEKNSFFFNLDDIKLLLENIPDLEYFSLKATFKIAEFDNFIVETRNSLPNVSELYLDLNFDNKILLTDNFKLWLQAKENLKYLSLLIGSQTDSPTIIEESLYHIFEGILALKHPYRLNLAIGHEDYYWSSFSEITDRSIVSDFIYRLTVTRALHLRMGTGYTDEEEVRNIMIALDTSPCLRQFIIGELFQNKSNGLKKEVIEFLSECSESGRFKEAMIGPPEWCHFTDYLIDKLQKSLTPRMWKADTGQPNMPDFGI